MASEALGNLQELLEGGTIGVVLTSTLEDFVEAGSVHWARVSGMRLLREVHMLLQQWVLYPHDRLVRVPTAGVPVHSPHPIPESCSNRGLVAIWSDELGRLLAIHDQRSPIRYFIAVACARSFSGRGHDSYPGTAPDRCFPLVGPHDISSLEDAYEWDTSVDVLRREVSFASAYKHLPVLGARSIQNPSGGSHYIVKFPGGRSWPLDRNTDPLPDRFLAQLGPITGLPKEVVKTVLIEGTFPPRRLRL